VLDHSTERATGRKWKEAKETFAFARAHANIWLAPIKSKVALIYHTENVFAWQAQPQSTAFDFANEAHRFYYPFWRNGVQIDVISAESVLQQGGEFLHREYAIVLLPALMIVPEAFDTALEDFVRRGGSLWVGFRSDLKDENGQIRRQPSRLAALSGVSVEEIESLNAGQTVKLLDPKGSTSPFASVWREGVKIADKATTHAIFSYAEDDLFLGKAGLNLSAVTRKRGKATTMASSSSSSVVYVGAGVNEESLVSLASETLDEQGVDRLDVPKNPFLEQRIREDINGEQYVVDINHDSEPAATSRLGDDEMLQPYELRVTKRQLAQ